MEKKVILIQLVRLEVLNNNLNFKILAEVYFFSHFKAVCIFI